jgi:hypothetical protein
VSEAAENKLIFGGCVRGHRKLAYSRRPSYADKNINLFSAARVGPPKMSVVVVVSWGTRQSGAAPDRHCSLSGAPSSATLTLRELSAQCSRCRRPLESTVALPSRCSTGTLDSPVNYSRAASEKPEGEEFRMYGPWCTGHCPVAHRTVRCVRPGFSSVSFAPFF